MTGKLSGNGPGPRDVLPQGTRLPLLPDTNPLTGTAASGEGPFRRVVRIVNPNGLHPRLADWFKRTCAQYVCTVVVWNGETRADGNSLWDLIGLMAMPDSDVILEVDGPDASKAIDPLAGVLGSPGGENYTI